jgi:hypothetical protein
MKNKIKVVERIHPGFLEWQKARERGIKFTQMFGHARFIYTSPKGEISLIQIIAGSLQPELFMWEIYSLNGNLFEDVERFKEFEDADKAARSYLE